MTDMNRRTLLALLGSVPVVGGLMTQAQKPSPKPKQKPTAESKLAAVPLPKWPVSTTAPDIKVNPGIRLIFQGVMAFCHRGKECEIGFLREHDERDNKHQFEIKIFEIVEGKANSKANQKTTAQKCRQIFYTTDENDSPFIKKISLAIDGESSDVSFFHVGPPNEFDRYGGHPNDFWWVLDLDDIYGRKLPKNNSITKLTVKHGVFYTYQRTNSTFTAKGGPYVEEDKGYMPKIIAADLRVPLGRSVTLKTDGNDLFHPLEIKSGTRYEVYFSNECWTPEDKKCPDMDFPLNFKITKLKDNEQFKLVRTKEGDDDPPPYLCITEDYKRGSDRAPCMGVGFGQGDGIPT